MAVERVELGCPGHFICAKDCHWRRHTQVGNYRVSSVGDLFLATEKGKRQPLGAGEDSFFETMVFELVPGSQCDGNEGCGCREVKGWSELDGVRYATAGEAQAGHEKMVEKYALLAERAGRGDAD